MKRHHVIKGLVTGGLATVALLLASTGWAEMADGKWLVRSGDSLSKIVTEIAPASAQRGALMRAIVEANPQAFKDGNPDKLAAGATLLIPDGNMVAKGAAKGSAPVQAARAPAPTPQAPSGAPILKPQADGGAGMVVYTKGSAMAAGQGGDVRELRTGDSLFNGETLSTGPGSYMRIRYSDGTTMLLRPRTRFVIEDYQYSGNSNADRSVMRLVKGGFRSVTGAIGKNNQDAYQVRTPIATIGIRGTDYTTIYCEGDCVNIPDGLYSAVDAGGTTLSNADGSLDLDSGQSGYAPLAGGRPVRLRVPPGILKLPSTECS